MNGDFTRDWFSLAVDTFKHFLKEYEGKPNLTFLEIGSFEGLSARWMLEKILTGEGSKIICVDTFEGGREYNEMAVSMDGVYERFLSNLAPFTGKFEVRIGKSQEVLRDRGLLNTVDVVYVDGSHSACDCLEDIILSFRILKDQGIMFIDDYLWRQFDPLHLTPKIAVDAFCQCFKGQYKFLHMSNKTVVIRKAQVPINHTHDKWVLENQK